jgi:hypothetical protein
VDNGQTVPDSLTKCHAYDIIKDKWNEMPDLPEGRIGASAIVVNQTLYCIGGHGKLQSIFSLSLQTPATEWTEIRGELPSLVHSGLIELTSEHNDNK